MPEQEYLREFEFLPNLPKSNLDDREFNDLVQECILRIPRYCPEWTNHNPGDPGITLVELFAWLTDQMLYRFNQVPRRYYVAFLELLGIRLDPPVSAKVDLTFYLTKAQTEAKCIPTGTEVATIRTETEEAVVFTTDKDLIIGQPKIKYLLTDETDKLTNLSNIFDTEEQPNWDALGNVYLFPQCQPDNCFYIVLEATQAESSQLSIPNQIENSIQGNILAFTFRGAVAAPTGINPETPPRKWSAWDGTQWVDILRNPQEDDRTKGFSFQEFGQQLPNLTPQGADVILHLPQDFPVREIGDYRGYWIRCVYTEPQGLQYHYQRSPQISSIAVRSLGGEVSASECISIEDEMLGVSDGKSGQTFQLQGYPVLKRDKSINEYIQITLPNGEIEDWEEVEDFADSDPTKKHYIIDSRTGVVQFGPLVREPNELLERMQERQRIQTWGKEMPTPPLIRADMDADNYLEWQYGAIPPAAAEVRMLCYRIGGGSLGNVQANQLTVLKTAIPYVKKVTNYQPAKGGKEGQSLDQAVMRVPQILRTSKTAITPEDFQNIAERHSCVYRAYCPPSAIPGEVQVLIIPDARDNPKLTEADFYQKFPNGIDPEEQLTLTALDKAKQKLEADLNEHKSLGIQVKLAEPEYVGVKVRAEVFVAEKYQKPELRLEIHQRILRKIYYFLNPITGGFNKTGWLIGNSLKTANIVAILQEMPEVGYVGNIQLFSIRKHPVQREWICSEYPEFIIDPGKTGLICSWEHQDTELNSEISFLD